MSETDKLAAIVNSNGFKYKGHNALSGGDINSVYKVKTDDQTLVVKLNNTQYLELFEQEAHGLLSLQKSKSFSIPNVVAHGQEGNLSFLILEYIPSGRPKVHFWKDFAKQLAQLHRHSQAYFGYHTTNYIGSLKQYNDKRKNAAAFFIEQRLQPQLQLATANGHSFNHTDALFRHCETHIPNEPPALIHGDLWSGNYLLDDQGAPVLIDPAVAFASREMDLAMMQLFGGFHKSVYFHYNAIFPLIEGWESRIKLWQLYYVLVHVNLFGRSYFVQAQSVINQYTS